MFRTEAQNYRGYELHPACQNADAKDNIKSIPFKFESCTYLAPNHIAPPTEQKNNIINVAMAIKHIQTTP
jgi:hypothetical protein